MDPLKTGDLIILKHVPASGTLAAGYLLGDQSYHRVGVQGQTEREALNFEDYVFRMCPMFSYRQRNELNALLEARKLEAENNRRSRIGVSLPRDGSLSLAANDNNNGGGGSGGGAPSTLGVGSTERTKESSSPSAAAGAASPSFSRVAQGSSTNSRSSIITVAEERARTGETLLRQRVEKEEAANAEYMRQLESGAAKAIVKYGDVCQLQHVQSGEFLTVSEAAATFDPDCRTLLLDREGSSAAYFRIM